MSSPAEFDFTYIDRYHQRRHERAPVRLAADDRVPGLTIFLPRR
jgi:hypothetical protein